MAVPPLGVAQQGVEKAAKVFTREPGLCLSPRPTPALLVDLGVGLILARLRRRRAHGGADREQRHVRVDDLVVEPRAVRQAIHDLLVERERAHPQSFHSAQPWSFSRFFLFLLLLFPPADLLDKLIAAHPLFQEVALLSVRVPVVDFEVDGILRWTHVTAVHACGARACDVDKVGSRGSLRRPALVIAVPGQVHHRLGFFLLALGKRNEGQPILPRIPLRCDDCPLAHTAIPWTVCFFRGRQMKLGRALLVLTAGVFEYRLVLTRVSPLLAAQMRGPVFTAVPLDWCPPFLRRQAIF
mmetsp:Transcript_25279/g.60007  ORF Transcript_25279/g.60007 Transcript_25279/m.60007 type:complete len:297 (-) Transcript_25279:693-1583(-)